MFSIPHDRIDFFLIFPVTKETVVPSEDAVGLRVPAKLIKACSISNESNRAISSCQPCYRCH
jgi:hypothetical protein